MAEIKIEKKKAIWPWILLGLLILAIILYFLFFRNDTNDMVKDEENEITAPVTDNSMNAENKDVEDYVNYVNSDTTTMGLDHTFTHNALIKLVDATKSTADKQNFDIQADLDLTRKDAEKITDDPMATTHADYIKAASSRMSKALQNMQQAKFPQLSNESQKVMDASNELSTADLTLDQKRTVHTFFTEAAELLQKMN